MTPKQLIAAAAVGLVLIVLAVYVPIGLIVWHYAEALKPPAPEPPKIEQAVRNMHDEFPKAFLEIRDKIKSGQIGDRKDIGQQLHDLTQPEAAALATAETKAMAEFCDDSGKITDAKGAAELFDKMARAWK